MAGRALSERLRKEFEVTVKVVGAVMQPKDVSSVLRDMRSIVLRKRKCRNVIPWGDLRAILFDPEQVRRSADLDALLAGKPVLERLKLATTEFVEHELRYGYEEVSVEQALRKLLPDTIKELPASFESAGHLAHVNLRDDVVPFKALVGQVILDKNPRLRTVVNKTGMISNQFRTFPLEVIAGDDDTEVEVREYGALFRFDFAKVYWNSRLQDEHHRLVDRFEKSDTVLDAFCGVGPFAIPAAQKGCTVLANDLNPESYKALLGNLELNKVEDKVRASNEDARAYIRKTLMEDRAVVQHVIMNLPASALEFLDAFAGAFPRDLYGQGAAEQAAAAAAPPAKQEQEQEQGQEQEQAGPSAAKRRKTGEHAALLPMVHCYCFSTKEESFADDVRARAEAALGHPLGADAEVRPVRNVAPNKFMYCLHFRVPEAAAFAPAS